MSKLGEKILRLYLKLKYSEKGATAVEYGLLVTLIAVAIISAVFTLGGKIAAEFGKVSAQMP